MTVQLGAAASILHSALSWCQEQPLPPQLAHFNASDSLFRLKEISLPKSSIALNHAIDSSSFSQKVSSSVATFGAEAPSTFSHIIIAPDSVKHSQSGHSGAIDLQLYDLSDVDLDQIFSQ